MLQVASSVHTDKAERSLFLTYNIALASDVQRLISLAKIRSEDQEGGIRIQTVYSLYLVEQAWLTGRPTRRKRWIRGLFNIFEIKGSPEG